MAYPVYRHFLRLMAAGSRRPLHSALLWLSLSVLPAAVLAQAPAVGTFDLGSAVDHALAHNPELHAAQAQVETAAQQREAVAAASGPVVSLSHTARVSDNPLDAFADKLFTRQVTTADFAPALLNDPGITSLYLTSLSLQWPVYTGGKLEAQQQQSDISYQQSQLVYQRAQQTVAWRTMQAYLYVIATERAIDIAEQAVSAAQQHADTTARLAREGRIVESDKLAAEVNLAAVEAQQAQALTRHQHALTQLRQVMGLPADADIAVDSEWPQQTELQAHGKAAAVQTDITALMQQALKQRPDLQAAQKAIAAAVAGIEVASADKKPAVALVASSNWYDDSPGFDSQSISLMAVARINLYDGSTDGKIGAAKAQQQQQRWREQALQQAVMGEVKQAFDDLHEAQTRWQLARDNVTRAAKAVQLVQKRYGQGRTILLDLLQSERMLTESRIEKLTAELNLRISQLALAHATGALVINGEKQ